MNNQTTICIAGIGNTLRSDDGIGAYICKELEKENIHNATFQYIHQLQSEWIDEFSGYDYVLLIDAAVDKENKIRLNALNAGDELTGASSHYLDLGIFARLITGLMSTSPSIYLCVVPGLDFSFSEKLSPQGKVNADEAIKKIKSWLEEHRFMSARVR
jgi:hydrogenase maturation protease